MKRLIFILTVLSCHCSAESFGKFLSESQSALIKVHIPDNAKGRPLTSARRLPDKQTADNPSDATRPSPRRKIQPNKIDALDLIIKKRTAALLDEKYEYEGAYPEPEIFVPFEPQIELKKDCPKNPRLDSEDQKDEKKDSEPDSIPILKSTDSKASLLEKAKIPKEDSPYDKPVNANKHPLELTVELPQEESKNPCDSESASNSQRSPAKLSENEDPSMLDILEKPIGQIAPEEFGILGAEDRNRPLFEPSINPEVGKLPKNETENQVEQLSLEQQIDQLESSRYYMPKTNDPEFKQNESEKDKSDLSSNVKFEMKERII